jgi:hypothetical protein
MIFEIIEPYLEAVNLILALVLVAFGVGIMPRLKGELKNAWGYFLLAILLFGVHEIIGSLAEFNIFEIEGFYAFTEFIFITAFLFSVFVFKRLFDRIPGKRK